MKARIVGFLVTAVALLGTIGSARAAAFQDSMYVKIPFAFYVGGQSLPAGDYTIQADASANQLLISSRDGAHRAAATAESTWPTPAPSYPFQLSASGNPSVPAAELEYVAGMPKPYNPVLGFDRSGGQNFLRTVSDSTGVNFRLPESSREQSLTHESPGVQQVTVTGLDF